MKYPALSLLIAGVMLAIPAKGADFCTQGQKCAVVQDVPKAHQPYNQSGCQIWQNGNSLSIVGCNLVLEPQSDQSRSSARDRARQAAERAQKAARTK